MDPRNMVAAAMADSILVDPAEVIGGWENAVFFEVLDPRPENKSMARILHMERWRTKMSVRRQRVDIRGDAVWLTAGAEEGEMINLLGWCNEENFAAIMKGLVMRSANAGPEPSKAPGMVLAKRAGIATAHTRPDHQ